MFNKNGYEIRRDAIDTKTLDLVYEYHKLKVENNEFEIDTAQVTGTITMYGDTLNDAILRVIFIGLASLTFPHILLEYLTNKYEKRS